MIRELHDEVVYVLDEAFQLMSRKFNKDFILFIGKADVIPGLKQHTGTNCVIDYQRDTYYDETRTQFYLHYLNRNYKRDGFAYEGESGIDDLNIELMIYCHLWDSFYFMKALWRLATIVSGNGYLWEAEIPWLKKEEFMIEKVIEPLKAAGLKLGELVKECYDAGLRNAFAHSLYTIDAERREIHIRPRKGFKTFSFEEFQALFLKSAFLMNLMENMLEYNHNVAAGKNTALTETFLTPEGIKVQVCGVMQKRGDIVRPEFKIVKIIEN